METDDYFKKVKDLIVGKKITKLTDDTILLDDGTELELYESAQDCCAIAYGEWTGGDLEAGITDIVFNEDDAVDDEWDESSVTGTITILHNQNKVATAECHANNGNGGYYFSVLNLKVKLPNGETLDEEILSCY